MAELADVPDLGSGGNTVQVQVLLSAPEMDALLPKKAKVRFFNSLRNFYSMA